MGKITVLPETTKNPITLIGERAGICWGADITNQEKNYKRGLSCIKSNHGRTLEYPNIEIIIDSVVNTSNGSIAELSDGRKVFVADAMVKSGDYVTVEGVKYRVK